MGERGAAQVDDLLQRADVNRGIVATHPLGGDLGQRHLLFREAPDDHQSGQVDQVGGRIGGEPPALTAQVDRAALVDSTTGRVWPLPNLP
ncbi:hypothetical protein GCM10009835_32030 [Planosporangium flavigriseum]